MGKDALIKTLTFLADVTQCLSLRLGEFFDRQAWRLDLPKNPATTPEERKAVREEFLV